MRGGLERLRAEFLEMPGLRLTVAQAARLCSIEATICQAALNALVEAGFLRRGADGVYARTTEERLPHPRVAMVDDGPRSDRPEWPRRPYWFESARSPWACVRDPIPSVLTSTDVRTGWEPKDAAHADGQPMIVDWFEAVPPPHEFRR
jgi:hypothetical protein